MAIRKRGDTWQIDYYAPNGKRVRQSFKRKKDAEAEHAKRISLIAESRYLDIKPPCTTTLTELFAKYTENHQHQPSFQAAKKYYIEMFKEHFGADTKLDRIRYVDLETYRNKIRRELTAQGKLRSDAAVNRQTACLLHAFRKAMEWEMVEKSPFDKGGRLFLKENNQRLRYLSQDEIKRLLAECPTHLRWIVECAIHTGMRKGEILTLKWSQIQDGQIYLQKTKTNEPRQIPINDDLKALFKEIHQQSKSEHVFPPKHINKGFKAAVKRAGIEDFRFHDLRHTFASHLLMRGGALKDVQEILGHKTMTMTLRYAHLSGEHKRRAVNLLNGLTQTRWLTRNLEQDEENCLDRGKR